MPETKDCKNAVLRAAEISKIFTLTLDDSMLDLFEEYGNIIEFLAKNGSKN